MDPHIFWCVIYGGGTSPTKYFDTKTDATNYADDERRSGMPVRVFKLIEDETP